MKKHLLTQFVIITVAVLFSQQASLAQLDIEPSDVTQVFTQNPNERTWHSFSSWSYKGGTGRNLGEVDMFIPLWQDKETLLFADLRGQTDDDNNSEGNWGIGYRRLNDNDQIFGIYTYYDSRHTQFDNDFDQLMLGVELMTVEWEARVNGYIPEDNSKLVNSLTTTSLSGGTIFISGGEERAYYGIDAEIGALLGSWGECDEVELRGFIGGFHFDNDAANFPNISGPRGRLELRMYDLDFLGSGSRVVLAAELQHDQVRDTTGFGIVQVRIPLDVFSAKCRPKMSRIERRMVDRVVRDVDIVNHASQAPATPGIDPETSMPFGPVTVLDKDDDLSTAVPAAGSTVIIDGSAGQVEVTSTVVMNAGQTLRGGGFRVTGPNGASATFGTRPTINAMSGTVDVIGLDDSGTIRNLNITGGRDGILGNMASITGFTIHDVTITDVGGTGIALPGAVSGTITNSRVTGSGAFGLTATVWSGGTIMNNSISGSMSDNVSFGTMSGGMIMGNRFNTSMTGDGLGIGTLSSGTIAGNFFIGNSMGNGLDAGLITGGTIMGNRSDSNGIDGFRLGVSLDSIGGATVTGNTANSNTGKGYNLGMDMGGNTFTPPSNTGMGNTGGDNTLP